MPVVLYVLFVMSVLPIALALLGAYFRYRELGTFDNNHPRLQQARQTGVGARALAAQNNCWETLQIFLLVVFIAYASGVDLYSLTEVSVVFLCLRLVYLFCYLANYCWSRSIVYVSGMFCCVYIFGLSVVKTSF